MTLKLRFKLGLGLGLLLFSMSIIEAASIKLAPTGLVMRGKTSHSYCDLARGDVDGGYCQIAWADLEPTKGNYDFSLIDNAINAARNHNKLKGRNDKTGFKVLLRIRTGVYSPDWVKNEVGAIDWYFKDINDKYRLPIFWKKSFRVRYERLMKKLADRYDSNDVIGSVAASMCMTKHTEIMWNRTGRSDVRAINMEAMRNASVPYLNRRDYNCLTNQVDIHSKIWVKTPTIFGSHLYQDYNYTTGEKTPHYQKTVNVFNYCVSALGQRCILGNNSLLHNENNIEDNVNKAISSMANRGYTTYYQTHVFSDEGSKTFDFENLKSALTKASNWGAVMVELPMGWDCESGEEVTITDKTICTDAKEKSNILNPYRKDLKRNIFLKTHINPEDYAEYLKVTIKNPATNRYLFASGSVVDRAEYGWSNSPKVIGTDTNYYGLGYWKLIPKGNNFYIKNFKTNRFLFSTGGISTGSDYGWLGMPQPVVTDADYYDRAPWRVKKWDSNTYRLQNNFSKRYLMQTGSVVNGWEGGWLKSPSVAEVGSESNFYGRATWKIEGAGTDYLQ